MNMLRWIWADDFWRGYVLGAVAMYVLAMIILLSSFAVTGQ